MATYEYTVSSCAPDGFHAVDVAGVKLYYGSKTITGIRAKLSSGTGTFNYSVDPTTASVIDDSDLEGPLIWHFRAEDHFALSDGNSLTGGRWYSYNKNLAWFNQTTSTAIPRYTTGNGPGGSESVYFDGSNYFLNGASGTYNLTDTKSWTCVFVIGDYWSARDDAIIGTRDTAASAFQARWGTSNRNHAIRNDDGDEVTSSGDELAGDEIRVMVYDATANSNAGGVTEYINGAAALYSNSTLSTGLTPDNNFNFNAIGVTENSTTQHLMEVGLSELLMFEGALSATNMDIVEGYLAHKWFGSGQANPLPSGHTYKSSNPYAPTYKLSSDITLSSTYGTVTSTSQSISDRDLLRFYITKCQNPGELTVEITVT